MLLVGAPSQSTRQALAEIPSATAIPENIDVESWRADPDVQRMERVRDGDVEAFEALFRKHSGRVVRFAFTMLHSRERAEEAAQLVFLQLYRARNRYQPRARFLTYLYHITTNACLNELRRREYSVWIEALDTPVDDTGEGSPPAYRLVDESTPDPAEQVAGEKLATMIGGAIEKLPIRQRTAFLLGRVEGLTYAAVADSLDMSPSAVKSLIFRATAALRGRAERISLGLKREGDDCVMAE